MAIEERLLGFDIRIDARDYLNSFWDDARRNMYLLCPSIKWPLSVDPLIWPSVFRYSTIVAAPGGEAGIRANPQVASGGLWFDLEMMKTWYKEHERTTHAVRGIPIAVILFAEPNLTMDEFGSDVLGRDVRPPWRPADSVLLGFDVADAGMISGLTDCGYDDAEIGVLRPQWSTRLNEFGLLASLADALQFKELSDARVREHAPFYVYSLYRLIES